VDDRLRGFDAAVLMEVIEHVDEPRLPALCQAVFGHAAPTHVIVTTPNVEYNVRHETLPEGAHRHSDHRFEWTEPNSPRGQQPPRLTTAIPSPCEASEKKILLWGTQHSLPFSKSRR
jgi:hypothetical protein